MAQQTINLPTPGTAGSDSHYEVHRKNKENIADLDGRVTPIESRISTPAQARSFIGIPRIDVKAQYNAYFDGTSHPLSSRYGSLAEAQAAYPNAGITALTEEIDAVALIQAAYDASNGAGGILGLMPGARGRINRQVLIPNAKKCWLWGGPNVELATEGTGTAAAIKIVGTYDLEMVLRDLKFNANNSGHIFVQQNTAGIAHTLFRAGSSAIEIEACPRFQIEGVHAFNYDEPVRWSGVDNFIGTFRACVFRDNNYGFRVPVALDNSYENMRIENCTISNNNYDYWVNGAKANGYSGGSSWYIDGSSIDYNVLQQIYFDGLGTMAPELNNALFIRGCHIETSSECSGTAIRGFVRGAVHLVNNTFYEMSGTPTAFFEMTHDTVNGWYSRGSAIANQVIHGNQIPVFYNAAAVALRVRGYGNYRFYNQDFLLSRTGSGDVMEKQVEAEYAPLASPAFTGTPTAPTQTAGNNTTRIAITAFVANAVVAGGPVAIVEAGQTLPVNRTSHQRGIIVLNGAGATIDFNANTQGNGFTFKLKNRSGADWTVPTFASGTNEYKMGAAHTVLLSGGEAVVEVYLRSSVRYVSIMGDTA